MSYEDMWPRRGQHWDVFNGSEIQSIDEGNEPPYWPNGPCFQYDQDAAAHVLTCATRTDDDTPDEIVAECRAAVREIVASWDTLNP